MAVDLLRFGGMLAGMSDEPNRIMRCYEGKRAMYLAVVRAAQAGKLDEMDPMAVEMTREARFLYDNDQVCGWGEAEADVIERERELVKTLEVMMKASRYAIGHRLTLDEILVATRDDGWTLANLHIGKHLVAARSKLLPDNVIVAGSCSTITASDGALRQRLIIAACLDAMFAAKEVGLEVRL